MPDDTTQWTVGTTHDNREGCDGLVARRFGTETRLSVGWHRDASALEIADALDALATLLRKA